MKGKKSRGDSKIEGLPENQREQLWRWLSEEGVTYDQALERLWKDFGARVGRSALGRWFAARCSEARQERALELIVESARKANAVLSECEGNPAPVQKAMLEFVSRVAFERAVKEGEDLDAKALKEFALMALRGRREDREDVKLRLAREQVELEGRRVALLEKRAELAAKAEKTVRDERLTPAEQREKLRAIFGMACGKAEG